jgi:hypothetical protein
VQLVETEVQVFRNGQRLLQNPYGVYPQQLYSQPQISYGYGAPPQGPYSVFPYQQADYGYGIPPVEAVQLPLGEAIRQLPSQYLKVAFTKRSAATFAEEQFKASWGSVWVQLIFYALVIAISGYVDELITHPASSVLVLIANIFIAIIIIPIGFFAITGIYYLIARAFGGKGTFLAQIYTMLLFTVPLGILTGLLGIIPVFGPLANSVVGMYGILLSIRMIMGVHRLSGGKATAVIFTPIAVIFFFAILFAIVIATVRPA